MYPDYIVSRLWNKIRFPDHIGTDECWEWQGWRGPGGYGRWRIYPYKGATKRITALVHRVAYEITKGPIPPDLFVCHKCDNPPCCNPDHLWLGTLLDNKRDSVAKGRHFIAYGDRNGLHKHPEKAARGDRSGQRLHPERTARGEKHGEAKLTEDQVRQIRQRYESGGVTLKELAAEFGVSFGNIGHIIKRRNWKHIK